MTATNKIPSEPISGILLLNKSQGLSSNKALQQAKHLFNAKKAGHSGSLDPLATGMLPVCFGEATKICQYLLDADKCYETTGLLGIKTDTSDSTGQTIATVDSFNVEEQELVEVLSTYTGVISQIPSMYSALKHQGKPLYRYAREGVVIERQPRNINITQLTLNQFDGKAVSLTVSCSKGTYIRNLVEDIGDSLGVGAHVTRLHRVYTSGFDDSPMYTIEQLQEMTCEERMSCLIPMDFAIAYMASVFLSDDEVLAIRQGRVISGKNMGNEGDCVRLYNERSQFIGIGERMGSEQIKAKRLISYHSDPISA